MELKLGSYTGCSTIYIPSQKLTSPIVGGGMIAYHDHDCLSDVLTFRLAVDYPGIPGFFYTITEPPVLQGDVHICPESAEATIGCYFDPPST